MTQQSDHFSRHAGFELLRIISMMMIVLMHGIGHGGLGTTAAPGTFPYFIYWLLFMLGRVSTNCFVMLTGYFMWQSKTKASRLFRIEIQVLFYSLLTFVIGLFVNSSLYLPALFCGLFFRPPPVYTGFAPAISYCILRSRC